MSSGLQPIESQDSTQEYKMNFNYASNNSSMYMKVPMNEEISSKNPSPPRDFDTSGTPFT